LQVLRKTKIIGTAGPSSSDKDTIRQMVLAGMDVLRINLAHADHATASTTIDAYRAVCKELGTVACVFVDLQGSELRSSWLIDQSTRRPVSSVSLAKGQEVVLFGSADQSPESFVGWSNQTATRIGVGYGELGAVAKEDTIIRMADGAVEIKVEKILSKTEVLGRVASDCVLGCHKIVSIVSLDLNVPFLTKKDKDDAQWAANIQADFIAATFTRCKENIEELQDLMYSFDSNARCGVFAHTFCATRPADATILSAL
jgi:pyruvate kinase